MHNHVLRHFILPLAGVFLHASSVCASPRIVRTPDGPVRGVTEAGLTSFKGIPYALPPVGEMRWRAPLPAKPWKTALRADRFAPDCMQLPFKEDDAPLRTRPSEDCLYLNIWRPATVSKAKLPVMVWIHGGGFVNGGSSPAVYDGSAFARSGVILVSLNYRLGRFGYFAHPALSGETQGGPTANFGLMDQIAALKWVRRNIAAFGGDPANVTVFGESAGGGSVHLLMTAPAATGLFDKAIVESGGGQNLLGGMKTLQQAESLGLDFARRHGIAATASDAAGQLRALSADAVIDRINLATLFDRPDFSGPIMDGELIRSPVDAAYETGNVARVPLIVGANDADGLFFSNDLNAAYALACPDRSGAEAIYDPEGKKDAQRIGRDIWADTMMLEPARNISRALTALGEPVYAYRFAYVPEYLRGSLDGARHASEIPFVFQTVKARHGVSATAADLREAELVQAYWVGFAKTGKPEAPGRPAWPPYDPVRDELMVFGKSEAGIQPDPFRKRLDFVEQARSRSCRAR